MGIQIKKFRATTLQKAIEEVRSELGDDAIILQTESVREKGLIPKTMIEVTAAIDRKEDPIKFGASEPKALVSKSADLTEKTGWLSRFSRPKRVTVVQKDDAPILESRQEKVSPRETRVRPESSMNQLYAIKTFVEPLEKEMADLKTQVETLTQKPKQNVGFVKTAQGNRKKVFDPLENEILKLRADLQLFMTEKRIDEMNLSPFYKQLTHFWSAKGVSQNQVISFLKQLESYGIDLEDQNDTPKAVASALSHAIKEANVFEKKNQRIVILVGPTGVGKSTTIAKMAAYEKIKLKRSVTLISSDDFKIGGTDQMGHYARILDVPFIKTRQDLTLEEQIKLAQADTIFVDTFGVSPHDADRIEKLTQVLNFQDPEVHARVEIHLVLPVGISASDVKSHWEQFQVLNPQFLIFTKWDETQNWGGMLATILESRKPVAFICHGQGVPDDLSLFSKQSFIEAVTGFETLN